MARGRLLDNLHEAGALLKAGPMGLLLDLDGTLTPIVPEPGGTRLSHCVRSDLRVLSERLGLVAIITGRAAPEARDIVGLPDLLYVGNHGMERLERGVLSPAEEARGFAPLIARLLGDLRSLFPSEGLSFEEKGWAFAVHYRHASDPERARDDLLRAIQQLAGGQVKLVMGKRVVNVLPPVDLTKGTAVKALVGEYRLAGAVVIGDDVTDIDSFRAARELHDTGGFGKVSAAVIGREAPPGLAEEADFVLRDVSEVQAFLGWLVRETA